MREIVDIQNRALAWLFIVLNAICAVSCKSSRLATIDAGVREGRPALSLELKVPSGRLVVGDPISVSVELINSSSVTAWINGRLAANHPQSLAVEREVWLEVENLHGGTVSYRCVTDASPARASDYRRLESGARMSRELSLECWRLAAGSYRITAFYEDGSPGPPEAPPGAVRFSGMLVSPSQTLEIAAQ
jgi:hypothetical protein